MAPRGRAHILDENIRVIQPLAKYLHDPAAMRVLSVEWRVTLNKMSTSTANPSPENQVFSGPTKKTVQGPK
ncbi:hypothetical protein POX_f08026 [Penicillium oxalicum]|uniref:hypothetical protein n=1 Tax=Penicillium oxalicum TaxID=69781 RepID=UPI0020B84937|nr:hypothetical protein POX_f08026 [Penicillium oxalicum]KAI2787651.1 hypothetical protein POX_f08026 [Penicillium oxalicum]